MGTLKECVTRLHGPAAWDLLQDSGTFGAVARQVGYEIVGSDEIITDLSFDQLKLAMSASRFAESDQECVDVASLLYRMINRPDVFPLVSVHKGVELAARCFVSLSLFRKAMFNRLRRRAYPSPSFYREVGIKTLSDIDMRAVAMHFDNWAGFAGETMGA